MNKEIKTTEEIISDWDEYKNKHIDFKEDWTKEHDDYLNKKWVSYENEIGLLKYIQEQCQVGGDVSGIYDTCEERINQLKEWGIEK